MDTRYLIHGPLGSPETKHTSCKLPQADIDYILSVYDEPGVQATLPGALVARFADYLRSKKITTPQERRSNAALCVLAIAIDDFVNNKHETT